MIDPRHWRIWFLWRPVCWILGRHLWYPTAGYAGGYCRCSRPLHA